MCVCTAVPQGKTFHKFPWDGPSEGEKNITTLFIVDEADGKDRRSRTQRLTQPSRRGEARRGGEERLFFFSRGRRKGVSGTGKVGR